MIFNRSYSNLFLGLITLLILTVHISCSAPLLPVNADDNGIAIKGYDTVAYFTKGKPMKGKSMYQFEWNGAKWFFSNEEHMRLFMDFPERYAPKYGGY
jgi:YHS domain-containing protein